MKRIKTAYLVAFTVLYLTDGILIPNPTVDECLGTVCYNNGSLNLESCTCNCHHAFQPPDCLTAKSSSNWPQGNYAVPMTMFGCPEPEESGWTTGFVNLTLISTTWRYHRWPESFRVIGPYHLQTFQFTICARLDDLNYLDDGDDILDDAVDDDDADDVDDAVDDTDGDSDLNWLPGEYCLIKLKDYACPKEFQETSLMFRDYRISGNQTGGTLPDYSQDEDSFTLYLCCKYSTSVNQTNITQEISTIPTDTGRNMTTNSISNDTSKSFSHRKSVSLPIDYQFYFIKAGINNDCPAIRNMELITEPFQFLQHSPNTSKNDNSLDVVEDENYFFLNFCHYIPTERRECQFAEDKGASYRGTANTNEWGEPCLPWEGSSAATKKGHVGDFEENHCRNFHYIYSRPVCMAYKQNIYYYCSIPYCNTTDEPPNVARNRPVDSSPVIEGFDAAFAVDGNNGKPPAVMSRPRVEPWLQIDLQSVYQVHSVFIEKAYIYIPYKLRQIVVFASRNKWDFLKSGATICNGPINPREIGKVRFQCHRPILARYITIVNFVKFYVKSGNTGVYMLELAEVEVRAKDTGCGRPLGLASGVVQDFQFSSSSTSEEKVYPYHSRLNRPTGWCASSDDPTPYIQVDLIAPMLLDGIVIQGWVENTDDILPVSFILLYGVHKDNLTVYRDNENEQFTLDKSIIPDHPQTFLLSRPVTARYVRVQITQSTSKPCLKWELLGCPKRVEFDLSCSNSSRFIGWQELPGHSFYMGKFGNNNTLTDLNKDSCKQACISWYLPCRTAIYSTQQKSCALKLGHKYSRHNAHWYLRGTESHLIYLMPMCVKDISPMIQCGGEIRTIGELSSPGYPLYYGESINCSWSIILPPGQYVQVDLIDVSLAEPEITPQIGLYKPNMAKCKDELVIYDRGLDNPEIFKLDGGQNRVNPRSRLISTSNKLEINLVSCYRVSETKARGFVVEISVSDCPGCGVGEASCSKGVTCSSNCGYISSLNYPDVYPVSSACSWTIKGQIGQYVEASFIQLDILGSEECDGDFVRLYDEGLTEERHSLGKFCRDRRPISTINTNWNEMAVEFFSDFEETASGFMLRYELKTIKLQNNTVIGDSGCRPEWFSFGKNCYKFSRSDEPITWTEARLLCRQEGGYLVSINDVIEMEFLHSTMLIQKPFPDHNAYIGLQKSLSGGFKWDDGSPLSYSAWYEDTEDDRRQPDGFKQELCTMLIISSIRSLDSWHDVACSYNQLYQYICEQPGAEDERDLLNIRSEVPPPSKFYHQCTAEGHFIADVYVCDGTEDCQDGSDEQNCASTCPDTMFTCNNKQCINMLFYCDFNPHCSDDSDELHCVHPDCNNNTWRCDSGQCISADRRCDLISDCFDQSDEQNCDICPKSTFQCYDTSCIPKSQFCDGFVDCPGLYGEDEPVTCTSKSQPSCATWQAVGVTENGKYNINIANETVEVECLFDDDKTRTIFHHNMEDTSYSTYVENNRQFKYTASLSAIQKYKEISTQCYQHVEVTCHQSWETYENKFFAWSDVTDTKRSFLTSSDDSCSCSLHDSCTENNTQCLCNLPRNIWFSLDDNYRMTDSGYLNDKSLLPIKKIHNGGQRRYEFINNVVGPLICEEEQQNHTQFLLCKSGIVTSSETRCIMEYNEYDVIKGCRDLSHLINCGLFECPVDYIKCRGSYCIPVNQVCDGRPDCPEQDDEVDCEYYSCPGYYRCNNMKVCLPWSHVCDGVPDCDASDDELNCNITCPFGCSCSGLNIQCSTNNITQQFLSNLNQDMRHLVLKGSNFEADNLTFSSFSHLGFLDISFTDLKSVSTSMFRYLYNVFHLDLGWNEIQSLQSGIFTDLKNLKFLNLLGNHKLQLIDPMTFVGLVRLEALDLSGLDLQSVRSNQFYGLESLKRLNISYNRVTSIQDQALSDLTHCQILDMRSNNIKDFGGSVFNGLSNLSYLYSDRYTFCCIRPTSVPESQCLPDPDEFSSCSDLMKNSTLRISMWILGIVALLGNMLVLLYRVVVEPRDLKRSNGVIVANLGFADFIMGIYMLMIATADVIYRGQYSWNDESWRNSISCQIAGFLATFSSEASVMFLCLITIDRVIAIKFPFTVFRINRKSAWFASGAVWILSFVMAAIPLLPLDYFSGKFYSRTGVCLGLPLTKNRSPGWEYGMAIFILWNCVCFIIVVVGQGVIYHTVKKSGQKVHREQKVDMAVARKLSFIVMSDFLCWFPICVMGLLTLRGHIIPGDVYAWVAVFILPVNSALNPIIYSASSIRPSLVVKKLTRNLTRSLTETSDVSGTRKLIREVRSLELFHVDPPQDSVALVEYLRGDFDVRMMLDVVTRVAKSLHLLHSRGFIIGELNEYNIFLSLDNGILKKLSTVIIPVQSTEYDDMQHDVTMLGAMVSKMLKTYGIKKKILKMLL